MSPMIADDPTCSMDLRSLDPNRHSCFSSADLCGICGRSINGPQMSPMIADDPVPSMELRGLEPNRHSAFSSADLSAICGRTTQGITITR